VLSPLDFLARLAALVPKPRSNLTRFHGIFAPNAKERSLVTPAGRRQRAAAQADARTPQQRRQAMTWAQRLRRVFAIDLRVVRRTGAQHHRVHRGAWRHLPDS
jgi:hypothetical protein